MKSPSGPSAITQEWVEFVVQHHEAKTDGKVKVTTFQVTSATKPGESFNAELAQIDVGADVQREVDGTPSTSSKNYSFVAKFMVGDPLDREVRRVLQYDVREYTVYSEIIPDLNTYWQTNAISTEFDQKICIPDFIYGVCSSSENVLIMENCKTSNFVTNDKLKGLDLQRTLLAVNQIARVHAISYAYNKSNNFVQKYPSFVFNQPVAGSLKLFSSAMLDCAIKYLKTVPEHKDILAKLKNGRPTLPHKFKTIYEDQSRQPMLSLTHGDFWNSNMLFRCDPIAQDGERIIEEIKLIDWQVSQWSNPVFDLHYLLNTSTNATLRENHLDEILHHYHETFMGITQNLRTDVPNWNYDEFYAEYRHTALVGFFNGLCLILGTLSKTGEKLNPNPDSSGIKKNSILYKMKTAAAKVIVPLTLKPSSQFLLKQAMKKMTTPIGHELIEGKNKIMNDRFLDLLLEADKTGVLDAL